MRNILECYFDDSSDDRHQKYFASGGFMGNEEQCDLLDLWWATETRELTEPFRAAQCETGHGQFETWEKPKRDSLMARLVRVIRTLNLFGFASVVPLKPFKRVFPSLSPKDAYLLTVVHAIINSANIANNAGFEARLCFEQGSYDKEISRAYQEIQALKWAPARRITSPLQFDSKKLRLLQPADLIAREAFKHIDNLGVRRTRKPVRMLSNRLFFMLWTEPVLAHLAENGGPANLEFLINWPDSAGGPKFHHFWRKSWDFHAENTRPLTE